MTLPVSARPQGSGGAQPPAAQHALRAEAPRLDGQGRALFTPQAPGQVAIHDRRKPEAECELFVKPVADDWGEREANIPHHLKEVGVSDRHGCEHPMMQ